MPYRSIPINNITHRRSSWIDFSSSELVIVGCWCPWRKIKIIAVDPATDAIFLFSLGALFDDVVTIVVIACHLGASLETWIGSGKATQQGGTNVVGGTGRN
jgi:hypothetical protein